MGRALELVSFYATAPGAGGGATAVTGNSLIIRDGSNIALLGTGGKRQATGIQRITSPLLHDNSVGIYETIRGGNVGTWIGHMAPQELRPQDLLSTLIGGSAVAGDVEIGYMQIWYGNLPGVDGRFIDVPTLRRRIANIYSRPYSITATAAGGYTGSIALNAASDSFKRNTEYAILGLSSAAITHCSVIRIVGPDWGNVGFGVPMVTDDSLLLGEYFCELSQRSGLPCIPIFNSGNVNQVFLSSFSDENAAAFVGSIRLAELK